MYFEGSQWLERLTADQQVPGSNPGVPSLGARRSYGRLALAAADDCLHDMSDKSKTLRT